ncbi:MAG: type III-B CRISPR module RAMP protein Cmr6, partial [Thermoflexales bacterium]|nr:type III-B CRISPR module RAMP protein Cmr6 [Thermoflexales bacterium]
MTKATRKPNDRQRSAPRSSNELSYPLPRSVSEAYEKAVDKQLLINPALVFDRFAPEWSKDATLKQLGLRAARDAANRLSVGFATLTKELLKRWKACVEAAGGIVFELQTEWRFVAGLGRKGPLEVGFAFNRYGIPVLPGSSVKGIARAAALLLEEMSEDDEDFVTVFGRAPRRGEDPETAVAGQAIFFDALPHKVELELDVMNPHFPDYYRGEAPPTNWQSPVPVYFLTVARGVRFSFGVGWRGKPNSELHLR